MPSKTVLKPILVASQFITGFPRGSAVKNLPTMQETWVQSLGWKDSLEEGIATHLSILAWEIPWAENLVGYSPWGRRVRHNWSDWACTHSLSLTLGRSLSRIVPRQLLANQEYEKQEGYWRERATESDREQGEISVNTNKGKGGAGQGPTFLAM